MRKQKHDLHSAMPARGEDLRWRVQASVELLRGLLAENLVGGRSSVMSGQEVQIRPKDAFEPLTEHQHTSSSIAEELSECAQRLVELFRAPSLTTTNTKHINGNFMSWTERCVNGFFKKVVVKWMAFAANGAD